MHPLAYGTNLLPLEDLPAMQREIPAFSAEIRSILQWDRIGLDLRLGSGCLGDRDGVLRLRDACLAVGAVVTTINGFPLRPFQTTVVKENAYAPDWTTSERLEASIALMEAALLLIDGPTVTISTVPGAFRDRSPATIAACAANLGRWAAAAHRQRERDGRTTILCLEPEPWCLLETSADVAWFWRGPLATIGLAAARADIGDAAPSAMARHLGICLDTCHLALAFEEAEEALARIRTAGATIAKCQVSAAPEVHHPGTDAAGIAALGAMAEPRFLHQVAARSSNGSLTRALDLDGLSTVLQQLPHANAVRAHFHIPISRSPTTAGLSSTIGTAAACLAVCRRCHDPVISVETYTWPLLTTDRTAMIRGTAAELLTLAQMESQS